MSHQWWDREVETHILNIYNISCQKDVTVQKVICYKRGRLLLMCLSGNNITYARINRTDNDLYFLHCAAVAGKCSKSGIKNMDNSWVANNQESHQKLVGTCSCVRVLDLIAESSHSLRNKIMWVGSEWWHDPTERIVWVSSPYVNTGFSTTYVLFYRNRNNYHFFLKRSKWWHGPK